VISPQQRPQPGEGRNRRVVADREPAPAPGLIELAAAGVIALVASGDHVADNRTPTIPYRADMFGRHQARIHGVPIDSDPRALAILHEWVKTTGAEMNEAAPAHDAHP
jgi:hypothetical protein